jgi:hypothetical protein
MDYLTTPELIDLDSQIDEHVKSFRLLSRPRDEAVLHLLSYFDLWIEDIGKKPDINRRNGYQVSYEALNHSIRWVFKYCVVSSNNKNIVLEQEGLNEVSEIFGEAMNYQELWVQMSLLHKGRNVVSKRGDNVFWVASTSTEKKEIDIARMLLTHADDPRTIEDTYVTNKNTETYVQNKLKIGSKSSATMRYSFPSEVFSLVKDLVTKRHLRKWTMDKTWNLGGYTYEQLKEFWDTLNSLSIIHAFAARTLRKTSKRLNSLVKIQLLEDWVNEISKWSKLSRSVVSQIIIDTIYDTSLHQEGAKKLHVMYQPFFRLEDNRLALSGTIVQITEIERNVWDLISRIRPQIHDQLKNLKEGYWIRQIIEKTKELNIKCVPDIKFKFEDKNGQIDLIMIDHKLNFGLICELKWLTPAASVEGVAYNDKQLEKGITQAELAARWVDSKISELSVKVGISIKELDKIEWKPLVIGKNSLPSGHVKNEDVPIINELLLMWILDKPHYKDLRSLWCVANTRGYLPIEGKHFQNTSMQVEWGSLRFVLHDVGFNVLKPWRPETDIIFPDS